LLTADPCLLGQAAAVDQLHGEERLALVLADFVDGHDVGVVEGCDGGGLGAEALQVGGRGLRAGAEHLEGDDPAQALLAGLVDDAHAAAGDLFKQLVTAQRLAGAGGLGVLAGRTQRPHQAVEPVLVGEEGDQLLGQLGVVPEQFLAVGGLAAADGLQVGGQDLVQQALVVVRVAYGGVHRRSFLRLGGRLA
jgi:hypothetical protein